MGAHSRGRLPQTGHRTRRGPRCSAPGPRNSPPAEGRVHAGAGRAHGVGGISEAGARALPPEHPHGAFEGLVGVETPRSADRCRESMRSILPLPTDRCCYGLARPSISTDRYRTLGHSHGTARRQDRRRHRRQHRVGLATARPPGRRGCSTVVVVPAGQQGRLERRPSRSVGPAYGDTPVATYSPTASESWTGSTTRSAPRARAWTWRSPPASALVRDAGAGHRGPLRGDLPA
ncbi:hypothetical protein SALBM311S_13075 [Streptomyces alboniger]